MSEKILVPTLGESITEATVSKWLKDKGEKVAADEPIVELETDKVNVEVPAPSNGVLESISVNEGETVNVGALLGVINGAAAQITNDEEDVKDYSPPKKKQVKKATKKLENIIVEKTQPSVFKKDKDNLLILDKANEQSTNEEEVLVLDNFHEEKKKTREVKKMTTEEAEKITGGLDIWGQSSDFPLYYLPQL